jgi:hypothetical protein
MDPWLVSLQLREQDQGIWIRMQVLILTKRRRKHLGRVFGSVNKYLRKNTYGIFRNIYNLQAFAVYDSYHVYNFSSEGIGPLITKIDSSFYYRAI